MSNSWEFDIRERLDSFARRRRPNNSAIPISVKVRVTGGCYHREHSPNAYKIIDSQLHSPAFDDSLQFEEHESGPELLLLYVTGINLATGVINFISTMIKARSDGIKKGDHPSQPIELIVRSFNDSGKLTEETILHIDSKHSPNKKEVELLINAALNRMFPKSLR